MFGLCHAKAHSIRRVLATHGPSFPPKCSLFPNVRIRSSWQSGGQSKNRKPSVCCSILFFIQPLLTALPFWPAALNVCLCSLFVIATSVDPDFPSVPLASTPLRFPLFIFPHVFPLTLRDRSHPQVWLPSLFATDWWRFLIIRASSPQHHDPGRLPTSICCACCGSSGVARSRL